MAWDYNDLPRHDADNGTNFGMCTSIGAKIMHETLTMESFTIEGIKTIMPTETKRRKTPVLNFED